MFKKMLATLLIMGVVTSAFAQEEAAVAKAEENVPKWSPLQISFLPNMQWFEEDYHILGLKLNLVNGSNDYAAGVELGLLGNSQDFDGVQVNLANYVGNTTSGVRLGLINGSTEAKVVSLGGLNWDTRSTLGISLGLVNLSGEMRGIQIGIFNSCENMKGVQIGLLNCIKDKGMSWMPLINAKW